MPVRWNVDDATTVELETRSFGRRRLTLNGTEIPASKRDMQFALADGRQARLRIARRVFTMSLIELRVDDRLMAPAGKSPYTCAACGTVVNPNSERFCRSCGKPLPPPEHYVSRIQLGQATGAIWVMSVLFVIGGIVLFFIARWRTADLLSSLEGRPPEEIVTTTTGLTMSVAALQRLALWEQWGPLAVNLILAAVMVGLAFWSRRSPLAAVLVAAATYATIIVANAMLDPATIAQGVFLKIIVILVLIRGIKAGMSLRAASA